MTVIAKAVLTLERQRRKGSVNAYALSVHMNETRSAASSNEVLEYLIMRSSALRIASGSYFESLEVGLRNRATRRFQTPLIAFPCRLDRIWSCLLASQ